MAAETEASLQACYAALTERLFPEAKAADRSAEEWAAAEETAQALERRFAQERAGQPFDPLQDLLALTAEELDGGAYPEECRRFEEAAAQEHVLTLLRLSRLLTPFDPAGHTIGVHNVALLTARQAATCDLSVDLPLLHAASLAHDIGKFGCRGEELAQLPRLHYRYTEDWLLRHKLPQIANIAAHHAIWELENDALPTETKLLIYADIRVRGTRENGQEHMRIYTLSEAHAMIRAKLLEPTAEKVARYERVFARLERFEQDLIRRGADLRL